MGDLLLVRLADGRAVAFAATCPHQATDLADGCLVDGRIRCALHHYEYDLTTGENVVPTRDTDPADLWKAAPGYLPVFAVEERDGWVWVGDEAQPPPASYDPASERRAAPGVAAAAPVPVDHVVRIAQGTTFELRLTAPPQPGSVWRVETGGASLAVVGERAEPEGYAVRLVARAPGRWTVRCTYGRPWDREPAVVRRYEVLVSTG